MTPAQSQRLRLLASALSVLLAVALLAGVWFYLHLRRSLPVLDGSLPLNGLTAPVTVTRDALGVPTVRGATRGDVAQALGFLHAQDRLFQLDLLRRRAAGELAGLFGPAALPLDRATRPHRFRELARVALQRVPPAHRALLDRYAAGVNAGRTALASRPFEYLVLRTEPTPWRAEDSMLVSYALTLDLQDSRNTYEHSLLTLRDVHGEAAVAFFAPLLSPADAALDASRAALPPVPGPDVINVRRRSSVAATPISFNPPANDGDLHAGSNSFALGGAHTASGTALLANDPHLSLSVPNIWYRAVLEWPAENAVADTAAPPHRIVGATLPGLPLVILGSNGMIAWSLTAAYADTSDLVAVDVNPVAHHLYKIPGDDALHEIEIRRDTIAVKGAPAVTIETPWTFWGPVVGHDRRDRPLALHWVAHDPAATDLRYLELETAPDTSAALRIAQESGIPATNFLVADRAGDLGWTIAGRLPKRLGFDGRLPVSWSFGDRGWNGYLSPHDVPQVVQPRDGRLWTANNRIVGGDALAKIGDGGYAAPARATQIRDRLATLEHATAADLFALQLDDRALFLTRWQQLLLTTLTPAALDGHGDRAEFRRLVETWTPRASIDSVGYRLVRTFRAIAAERAISPIFQRCSEQMPSFDWHRFHFEPALWRILQEKPEHLLASAYPSWDALLLAAVDQTIADVRKDSGSLDRATWGERNRARIQHPFARVLPPLFAQWLNLPRDPLPGDTQMPRIQSPHFGASLRLVVSPGREAEGLFHMPGGQSGHPLSPFYRAGHDAWVRGQPAPLLPGETQHTLILQP